MRVLIVVASVLLLAACGAEPAGTALSATDPGGSGSPMPSAVPAADGEVTGLGLVIDKDAGPELCLGPVAESYPPQCSGIPLVGWTWADHSGQYDTSGDVRFGSFAVTGTFDGTTLTVHDVVPGAAYDPAIEDEPTCQAGTAHPEAELESIVERLRDLPGFLSGRVGDQCVIVDVVHDDGSLQAWVDDEDASGLVYIRSALARDTVP